MLRRRFAFSVPTMVGNEASRDRTDGVIEQRAAANLERSVLAAVGVLAIWAEQQSVVIPGWLREDQNARLHQEKHFALIKHPRSPTTNENEAKRRW